MKRQTARPSRRRQHGGQRSFPQASGKGAASAASEPASWRLNVLAAALIVLAAVAAYHNSFAGSFVFDDLRSIVENRTIRRLGSIRQVLSPPCNGETVTGRPLLNLSLAINYAVSGLEVWSYHAANLLIHIAAALLLFGILRRTLLTPVLRNRFGSAATPLALVSVLMWTVHPLQTESVTYIVQRAESMAGLCYLLTLYSVIRGAGTVLEEGRETRGEGRGTRGQAQIQPTAMGGNKGDCPPRRCSWLWYGAAIFACLAGTACKEIVLTAPLIVLLYDYSFLSGSFTEAWRRRWGLYVGLAATWCLLGYLVFSTGLIGRQGELGAPDPWSYARSQPGVILHYLRLSVWPRPLCIVEDWPVAGTLGEILPGVVVVGVLAAATLWGLVRRRAWAFPGAWFLLILAPTSSILPLGQLIFAHRTYLSLAAVTVLAVVGGYVLWDNLLLWHASQGGQSPPWFGRFAGFATRGSTQLAKLLSPARPNSPKSLGPGASSETASAPATAVRWAAPVVVSAAVLLALGYATVLRNADYRAAVVFWQDTVEKSPHNAGAHNNLGLALADSGRIDEAVEQYRQALRLRPDYADAHYHLGSALANAGMVNQAIEHYREALRLKPDHRKAHNNLASALVRLGKTDEAIEHYRAALRLAPDDADFHNNLGTALAQVGKTDAAIAQYHEALRLKPDYVQARFNLGVVLAALGKTDDAIEHYRQALRLQPDHADAHNNLGLALAGLGKTDEAMQHYRHALRLNPDHADAHNNLAIALAAMGMTSQAVEHYQQALRSKPDYAKAHNNLGALLAAVGKTDEAIAHYRAALRLEPNYADAYNNLGIALANSGKTDEAIEQYRQALRLKPDHAEAHCNLGNTLAASGRTVAAIEHYQEALRLTPDFPGALNSLAWLLATRELVEGGDPARAVELAQRAREVSGQDDARCLDTLAAAYAAAGRFTDAAIHAERAAQLAESTGQAPLAKAILARLELYRAGRPYREAPGRAGPY